MAEWAPQGFVAGKYTAGVARDVFREPVFAGRDRGRGPRDPDSEEAEAAAAEEKLLLQARRAIAKAITALTPATADD